MPSLSDCCRKHILERQTPFVLRGVTTHWRCTQKWFMQPKLSSLYQKLQKLPYLFAHRCATPLFSHFTEERIHITLKQAILYGLLPGFGSPKQGLQLDGYWYYLSTPLPQSLLSEVPLTQKGFQSYFFSNPRMNLWSGFGSPHRNSPRWAGTAQYFFAIIRHKRVCSYLTKELGLPSSDV